MNSLFEAPVVEAREIPGDLIATGVRGISLLEFFAVEERAARNGADSIAMQSALDAEFAAREGALQMRVMIDAARAEAAAQAATEAREDFEDELEMKLAEERRRLEKLATQFAKDRQRYFAAAEAQVVRLALAIARRVLAREVSTAGLHLEPIVRAALARVQDGSVSVLRVEPGEAQEWKAMFVAGWEARVEVVADERVGSGECVLETSVGRVDLGVGVQMREIERGFGDLMRHQGE